MIPIWKTVATVLGLLTLAGLILFVATLLAFVIVVAVAI